MTLEILNNETIKLFRLFQFSEGSAEKLSFSSLVMLSTMEDRRSRLDVAEDSLVTESKEKSVTGMFIFYKKLFSKQT